MILKRQQKPENLKKPRLLWNKDIRPKGHVDDVLLPNKNMMDLDIIIKKWVSHFSNNDYCIFISNMTTFLFQSYSCCSTVIIFKQ